MKTTEQSTLVSFWCAHDVLMREASVARYHARQCWPHIRAAARAIGAIIILVMLFPLFVLWLRCGGEA